jgi:benzoylformate decarboxylase
MTATTATVRDVVRSFLIASGVTKIFGNPGSTEMRFFKDWPDDLDYVMVPQEAPALAMADGYAQASGSVGVVMLHSAAGLGNALGSLFTAERNGTPMVVIAGQQTRSLLMHDPYLFARRPTEFPHPYVKFAVEAPRPQDVPTAIAEAFRYAEQAPAGPVFVSVSEDDWDAPAEPLPARHLSKRLLPAGADLDRLSEMITVAARPVLVLGSKVATEGARDRAVELAERLQAPVLVAPVASRSPFPEDHPLFTGFLPPVASQIRTQLDDHDLVVVIGAPVFPYHVPSSGPPIGPNTTLVQIVDDPRRAVLAQVGDTIVGSVGPVIDALLDKLTPLRNARVTPPAAHHTETAPIASGMSPEAVMATLSQQLPPDTIIVEEAPTHRNAMHAHLPISRNRDFYVAASGGLGWGMPAAVGIAMAQPRRPVVCLIGDGSSLYSIQALWTAAQHNVNVVFVVLNNGGYAAMKAFGKLLHVKDAPGLQLPGLNFEQLAAGFGLHATRVSTHAELVDALTSVPTAGPRLLNVLIGPAAEALY